MVQIRIVLPSVLILFILHISANAQQRNDSFTVYEQKIPNSPVSFKMIPIPAGSFLMGSPDREPGHKDDEGPVTKVFIDAFWMEEHEVTYDEYVLFQDEERDPEPKPDGITRPSPPYVDFTLGMGKTGGFPANSMSQYGAIMYCKWLYQKTGIFYRLPTEAEWEYACRAGSATAYPFGNNVQELDRYAWWAGNSENKYHAVKLLQPNAWGLYDMLGNVAEWTLDQYRTDYYQQIGRPARNPLQQPEHKYSLTLRGGHFKDGAVALRSAARLPSDRKWNARDPQIPKSKWWNADAPFIGFRIVRPVKQPDAKTAELFYTRLLSLK